MTTRARVARAAAALSLWGVALVQAAERPWIEVKSPHFTVVSNADPRDARQIAWQYEQVRATFLTLWPWARPEAGRPIVVLAARDEATMKALAPSYWERKGGMRPAGVYVQGSDRDYIVLRLDVPVQDREGVNPFITAYWGYVSLILDSSFDRDLPLWYSRGLAEVFANTIIREKEVQVGRLIPWHLERLREGGRLSVDQLLAVDRNSPYFTQDSGLRLFDAEAWALVHYLAFGDEGKHLPELNRFAELIRSGRDAPAAVREAFGGSQALSSGLANYIHKELYQYRRMSIDLKVDAAGFTTRTLSSGESAAVRASLHAAMRRPGEARALLDQAKQAAPDLAAVWEVEAALAEAERDTERARAAYAKAVDLGSTSFRAHYRLAQLSWRADADEEAFKRIEKNLERTIELNHDYAPGYSFLAEVKARLRHAAEALPLARRAVALEPENSYHHVALARVLWAAGNREEALREARAGLAAAKDERDRRQADEMVAFLEKAATPPP
jgi:tetratricopeptide (TPR) repeat protein